MKKLPTIYKQEDVKRKNHNKEYCIVQEENKIEEDLNRIVNSLGPLNKKKVYIETRGKTYKTYLYKVEQDRVVTVLNEEIPIREIEMIKRIS